MVRSDSDSRSALLLNARRVFAEQGYEGATVKDLAEAAGVNVAMVSYYFGGKEGLYRAVLQSIGHEKLESAERALRPPNSAEEFKVRLKLFAEEFIATHMRDPDAMKIIHRDFDGRHPIALEVFKGVVFEVFLKMQTFMDAAKKNGILKSEVDADICSTMVFGALINSIRLDFLRVELKGNSLHQPEFVERFVDQVVGNLCEGIFVRGES